MAWRGHVSGTFGGIAKTPELGYRGMEPPGRLPTWAQESHADTARNQQGPWVRLRDETLSHADRKSKGVAFFAAPSAAEP